LRYPEDVFSLYCVEDIELVFRRFTAVPWKEKIVSYWNSRSHDSSGNLNYVVLAWIPVADVDVVCGVLEVIGLVVGLILFLHIDYGILVFVAVIFLNCIG
jgi:hypothetical protein